jgi:hypothetical protein
MSASLAVRLHDVALAWNADHRRRQVDIEAGARRTQGVVVDDHDLAPVTEPARAADQAAVVVDHRDDARAVRTFDYRDGFAAAALGAHVARMAPKRPTRHGG